MIVITTADTTKQNVDSIETEFHYDERRKVLQGVCVVSKPTEARVIDNLYYPAKIIWRTQASTPHDIFLT